MRVQGQAKGKGGARREFLWSWQGKMPGAPQCGMMSWGDAIGGDMPKQFRFADEAHEDLKTGMDVLAKVGMVEIRLKGKALGGGAYGDMIMVRDETNKTNVQGRITGKNEVTVVEEPVSEKPELLSKDFIGSSSRKEYQEN